jgi:rhodanese-related sulfurtransferase
MLSRRSFAGSLLSFASFDRLRAAGEAPADPWSAQQLIQPEQLAALLGDARKRPVVISVVFPVLFRQKHIKGAQFAGPTSKAEGISALKQTVSPLSRNKFIVLYCGCCPMAHCPNIRPAFETLMGLAYSNVHVLNLPSNFRADWEDKGYPIAS